MNGRCETCDLEPACGYEYKPCDCCDFRKFKPRKISLAEAREMAEYDMPLPEDFYIDANGEVQQKEGGHVDKIETRA